VDNTGAAFPMYQLSVFPDNTNIMTGYQSINQEGCNSCASVEGRTPTLTFSAGDVLTFTDQDSLITPAGWEWDPSSLNSGGGTVGATCFFPATGPNSPTGGPTTIAQCVLSFPATPITTAISVGECEGQSGATISLYRSLAPPGYGAWFTVAYVDPDRYDGIAGVWVQVRWSNDTQSLANVAYLEYINPDLPNQYSATAYEPHIGGNQRSPYYIQMGQPGQFVGSTYDGIVFMNDSRICFVDALSVGGSV